MKRGILLVAYGCGNIRGASALRSVQAAAEARFRLPVRWAFTSETMRLRLASSRTKSDSVLKALKRMRFERYTHVTVQPLHIIPGMEYSAVAADCRAVMQEGSLEVGLGRPLLSGHDTDASGVAEAAETLLRHISPLRSPDEPVICMAHGSRHECDILYRRLGNAVSTRDPRIHVACMVGSGMVRPDEATEASPASDGLDMLLPVLAAETPPNRRVWLLPLLSVVGRHTLEDMAGTSPSSWKSRIEAAGFRCQAELRGLADDPAFINLWLNRLASAMEHPDAFSIFLPDDGNGDGPTTHMSAKSSVSPVSSALSPHPKEYAMSASVISSAMEQNLSQGSMIRRMFEAGIELRRKYGNDAVCDFSLGNPDLAPPVEAAHAMSALAARLSEPGILGYMPNGGFGWAREKLAAWLSEQQHASLEARHVMLGCGAAGVMNAFFHTVLEPGDEVLTVTPYFVEYGSYVGNHGGTLKKVPTLPGTFGLDLPAIEAAITPKTRAMIINSPHNPTGTVYSREELEGLTAILAKASERNGRPLYLVVDEPYRFLAFDGVEVPSLLPMYPYAVLASSFSKNLCLAGERVGFIALSPLFAERAELMGGLTLANRILGFVNPPVVGQHIMAGALGSQVDVNIYARRREMMGNVLSDAGYEFQMPKGAFYFFPKAPGGDDVAFVNKLLDERILAVPGSGFGGPGHFRLAFCVEDEVIARSAEGFKRARG